MDADEEVMGNDEVLSEIGIETYHQELSVKGPLQFELAGNKIDTALFAYGTILNAETLKYAKLLPEQTIRKIVTVENKANFMEMSYEEGTLLVYSHGFFSPKERLFLKNLRECLGEQGAEYFHTSDLDYGGIRIFMNIKEKIFPDVKPLAMDGETFFKYQEYGEKRDEKYLQKVRDTEVPAELKELKDYILKTGCTIEQESMLF